MVKIRGLGSAAALPRQEICGQIFRGETMRIVAACAEMNGKWHTPNRCQDRPRTSDRRGRVVAASVSPSTGSGPRACRMGEWMLFHSLTLAATAEIKRVEDESRVMTWEQCRVQRTQISFRLPQDSVAVERNRSRTPSRSRTLFPCRFRTRTRKRKRTKNE